MRQFSLDQCCSAFQGQWQLVKTPIKEINIQLDMFAGKNELKMLCAESLHTDAFL